MNETRRRGRWECRECPPSSPAPLSWLRRLHPTVRRSVEGRLLCERCVVKARRDEEGKDIADSSSSRRSRSDSLTRLQCPLGEGRPPGDPASTSAFLFRTVFGFLSRPRSGWRHLPRTVCDGRGPGPGAPLSAAGVLDRGHPSRRGNRRVADQDDRPRHRRPGEMPEGSPVRLLGPLGNTFSFSDLTRGARVAIVAGGIGAAPFPLLLKALGPRRPARRLLLRRPKRERAVAAQPASRGSSPARRFSPPTTDRSERKGSSPRLSPGGSPPERGMRGSSRAARCRCSGRSPASSRPPVCPPSSRPKPRWAAASASASGASLREPRSRSSSPAAKGRSWNRRRSGGEGAAIPTARCDEPGSLAALRMTGLRSAGLDGGLGRA